MISNQRIRGATGTVYDGLTFKSLLECSCYKKLKDSGLEFEYEPDKFILWEGVKLSNVELYAPRKLGPGRYEKDLIPQTRALLNITYTPDFLVRYKHYIIYFDVKGKENDVYPLKKKMFLKYLEQFSDIQSVKFIFFEPHSVRQMLQSIEIIKNLPDVNT